MGGAGAEPRTTATARPAAGGGPRRCSPHGAVRGLGPISTQRCSAPSSSRSQGGARKATNATTPTASMSSSNSGCRRRKGGQARHGIHYQYPACLWARRCHRQLRWRQLQRRQPCRRRQPQGCQPCQRRQLQRRQPCHRRQLQRRQVQGSGIDVTKIRSRIFLWRF